MKFIKKIILKNFQSHIYSELEFDSNLNVIVGPSDSGKTSIIRGIRWVLFNEPSGDYFIREGEKECSVTLIFNDNSEITRYRSTSKNAYEIIYPDGEELILTGFGKRVPKEIEDITGISKIPFEQDSSRIVNISDQLEGPFLLSEKNSVKAFVIGGLAGVDIVDESIRDLLKELRNLNIKEKEYNEDIDKLNESLREFDDLDDLKFKLEKLNKIYSLIENNEKLIVKLNELNGILKRNNEEKKITNSILEKLKDLDNIKNIYLNLYEKNSLYNKFNNLLKKYKEILNGINESNILLEKFKYNEEILKLYNSLSILVIKYNDLELKNNKRIVLLESINNSKNITKKYSQLDELREVLNKTVKLNNRYSGLENINSLYKDIKKRQIIGLEYVSNFKHNEIIMEKYKCIEEKSVTYGKLNKINTLLNKNSMDKSMINKELEYANGLRKKYTDEYSNILLENKICPTCFSEIDEEKIENIVENLNK